VKEVVPGSQGDALHVLACGQGASRNARGRAQCVFLPAGESWFIATAGYSSAALSEGVPSLPRLGFFSLWMHFTVSSLANTWALLSFILSRQHCFPALPLLFRSSWRAAGKWRLELVSWPSAAWQSELYFPCSSPRRHARKMIQPFPLLSLQNISTTSSPFGARGPRPPPAAVRWRGWQRPAEGLQVPVCNSPLRSG